MNIQYDNIGNYKKSKNNKRKKYKRYKTPSYKEGFKDKVEEQFNVSDNDRKRLKLYSQKRNLAKSISDSINRDEPIKIGEKSREKVEEILKKNKDNVQKVQDKYEKLVKKGNRRIKLGAAGIALGGSALLYALANRRKKRKFLGIRY